MVVVGVVVEVEGGGENQRLPPSNYQSITIRK